MDIQPHVVFDRALAERPRVSLILLDWSCRESFHTLDYLERQDVPREWFEILWIEYYDRVAGEISRRVADAAAAGRTPPVDRWIVMNMPRTAYYHKHLMYNVGVLLSRGDLVMIGDSDAMVTPRFVRTLCESFDEDPGIVLHLDEVRSHSRRFYPFNHPGFEEVLAEGCINWRDGQTTGLRDRHDPLHSLNYGACFCARREDVIAIGGADEHIDYLGHICGPYDLTWRLKNLGRREVWHPREFLYHTWHPGSDGDDNYLGPHDGRNVSTLALRARRSGRVMSLVENPVVREVREQGRLPSDSLEGLVRRAIGDRPLTDWVIDDRKRTLAAGRIALARRRYAETVALWEPMRPVFETDPGFLSDLGRAYYFSGALREASACFAAALRLDADNAHARHGLAWALAGSGRHREALAQYSLAITHTDPAECVSLQEAYRGRAWSHFHLGEYPEAAADFETARQSTADGDSGSLQDIHRGLGWSMLRQRRYADAVANFQQALASLDADRQPTEADDARSGLRQAEAQIRSRPPAGGERSVTGGPAAAPTPASAKLHGALRADLGWAFYARRCYPEARELFIEALALDITNRRALCGLGWAALHLHRLAESRHAFDRLVAEAGSLDAQTAQEAHRGRGWVAYREGRGADAADDFTAALRYADPARDDAAIREIHLGRSRAYYISGLKRLAIDELVRVTGGSRLKVAARLRGGVVKNRIGAFLSARATWMR